MKTHMFRCSASLMGPSIAYCGRSSHYVEVAFEPELVTCETCRRVMAVDYCPTCHLQHVGWEPEDVCTCGDDETEAEP